MSQFANIFYCRSDEPCQKNSVYSRFSGRYGSPENDVSDKSKQKGSLLAVAGRVKCKADASYGEIKVGDLLTTSATPGYAMKANIDSFEKVGTVVGKALEPLKEGKGEIMVLITLH